MTIKINHGPNSESGSHRPEAPHSHRPNHPEHPHTGSNKTHAHDQTPARQREVEVRGHQNRAMVESHSNRSHHRSNSSLLGLRLDIGTGNNAVGVDAGAELLGLKLDLGIGFGNSQSAIDVDLEPALSLGHHRYDHTPGRADNFVPRAWGNRTEGELLSDTLNQLSRTLRETVGNVRDQLRNPGHHGRGGSPDAIDHTFNYADRLVSRISYALENRLGNGSHPEVGMRQIISDVISVGALRQYFSGSEQTGGEPVSRAYHAVMEFLLGQRGGEFDRLLFASELLRDLRNGAFLHQGLEGPFPLTGRARLVSEMIALMRTLEAIESFAERAKGTTGNGLLALMLGGGLTGRELAALLEQLRAGSIPTLPGLAGRLEIPQLANALGGLLTDAKGGPLLIVDGKPLKLGEMLWLNTFVNSVNTPWLADKLGMSSAPFLAHGFDSIFSLVGFDGRSLSLPRYVAIQSQVNAFEFDWVAGETPFNEAWMRFAIELLKDSLLFDHNVLGEMLEEALTAGRFHMAVMRGTVEEGKPVSGSFSFSPVYNFA